MRHGPWDEWPVEMDLSLSKDEFCLRVERVARSFIATVEACGEERLAGVTIYEEDGWSGKDVVAHCTFWAEYCAEALRRGLHRTFDAEDFSYDDITEFDLRAVGKEAETSLTDLVLRFRQAAFEVVDLTQAMSQSTWDATEGYKTLIAGTILEDAALHDLQFREVAQTASA